MPYTLEHNKIVGAVLTAMIVASASGNLARILYPAPEMEEPIVRVEAAAEGGAQAAAEKPEQELPLAGRLAQADPEAGATVAKKCTACHSFEKGGPHKVGPNLWGVVGREVAAAEGFAYSDALRAYGGTWTWERLDQFLADPKGAVPGNKMAFAGVKDPQQRADLLVWLAEQSDNPPPLPAAEAPQPEQAAAPAGEAPAPAQQAAAPTEGTAAAGEESAQAPAAAQETAAPAEGTAAPAAGEGPQAAAPTAKTPPAEQAVVPATDQPSVQEAAGPAGGQAPADPVLAMIATADPARGEKVARKCTACHSFEKGGPNKVGPNLWGVVGRKVASAAGFNYSQALRDFDGTWTWERLATFLADPRGTVPGTKMAFSGIGKPEDLAALLAWMRTRADEPAPLP